MKRIRRKTKYATVVFAATNALWLAVVCLYSIGVDREQRRLAERVVALERRKGCDCAACPVVSSDGGVGAGGGDGSSTLQPPRLRTTGRSGKMMWAEFEFPDGAAFRYYLRADADKRSVARWLDGIVRDAAYHQAPLAPVEDGEENIP